MNFPNLPGAKLRGDAAPGVDPSDDAAEVERRLAALGEQDAVPVRPEWLEATVAKAVAARPTVRRASPFRRLLAAAVAMLGVHGMLAAATVATVGAGVAVAAVVWTAGRNSNETMSYAMALEILRRGDQSEQDCVAALKQVVGRVRSVVTVLQELRDGSDTPPRLVELATAALDGLRSGNRGAAVDERGDEGGADPLPVVKSLRSAMAPLALREAGVHESARSARTGLRVVARAPSFGTEFAAAREQFLQRIDGMLER